MLQPTFFKIPVLWRKYWEVFQSDSHLH